MTVNNATVHNRYVGLAADSKPTSGVPAGTEFFELDTGTLFMYSGAAWVAWDGGGGNIASGATDAGYPTKVGGKYNATLPTFTDGQRGDLQLGTNGQIPIEFTDNGADGATRNVALLRSHGSTTARLVGNGNYTLGGASTGPTWDAQRASIEATLLTSAARTTTQTSADITTYGLKAIDVILDVTSIGTGNITLTINGKDPASGKYYSVLAGAAVSSNTTNVYRVGPGLTASANAVANFYLPRTIQIVVTANNANSVTYSVGYTLMHG